MSFLMTEVAQMHPANLNSKIHSFKLLVRRAAKPDLTLVTYFLDLILTEG